MRFKLLVLFVIVAVSVAACGSTAQPTPTAVAKPTQAPPTAVPTKAGSGTDLPPVDPLAVSGDIISAGSSTVYPLSEAIALRFKDEGYKGNITIDSIGSGAGFERFCKTGETDIANASRPIKDSEREQARAIGREPIEFRVGRDALAVVVSAENTFLSDVSLEQLAKVFSANYVKWSDVDASWPSENILRFSPGTDSGTFDYFVEEVLDKNKEALLNAKNLQLSEDDNVLVQGVEGSPYAIGYFGFAYYEQNRGKLKALSIDGTAPSAESVDKGTYKLARPLFLYTTAKIMQEKPQVAQFINFYLSYVDEVIGEVGYFSLSKDAMLASRQTWLKAMGM